MLTDNATCVTTPSSLQGLALLADVLDYPTPTMRGIIAAGAAKAPEAHGAWTPIAAAIEELAGWLAAARPGEPEERYTQLFDLKPVCTLNIGYHLFGDTYARGAFLAQLNRELAVAEVDLHNDLPDYLPTMLRLLCRLQDEEDRWLLVHSVLVPGLRRIGERLEASPGPYPAILVALPDWLEELMPVGDREVLVPPLPEEEEECSM